MSNVKDKDIIVKHNNDSMVGYYYYMRHDIGSDFFPNATMIDSI